MIVILYNEPCKAMAQSAQNVLSEAFRHNVRIEIAQSSTVDVWQGEAEWNDLLIVLFDENLFPARVDAFINNFKATRRDAAMILPVSVNPLHCVPPGALSEYKALPYDRETCTPEGQLVRRVGAMQGLMLQGRNTKVFISYRASDGTQIASQIETHIRTLGYKPWRDEARELDGYTSILPGEPVQQEIEAALSEASLVLVIDTPESGSSRWIRAEIDAADAMLIPILPVVFRTESDMKKGPRLRTLLNLQRWVDMPFASAPLQTVLSSDELNVITHQIETYLCDIFIRKCRVPFLVENCFRGAGYDWTTLDRALSMFKSSRVKDRRFRLTVHSHCSAFSEIYSPALDKFRVFLGSQPYANHALYIYDGDLLSFEDIELYGDDFVTVLHHQELSALLASNFVGVGI
ncbi:toll/interleukin-1 receptor domain-containing protein (plasmid) [Pantoea sp. BJ2]|uniref:Toll/interleukin-1 receptor domain-containing protein n=1 Tax=Pantoea sp. BJ2 TaxID=3141322 RepID=A0AAU7U3R4_9GAMM